MARSTVSGLQRRSTALETELDRFERLGREAVDGALDSQKSLERARRLLDRLAEAETSLNTCAGELAQELGAIRDRQQTASDAVTGWARGLQARIDAFTTLQQRFGVLGTAAASIQDALQRAVGDPAAIAEVRRQVDDAATQAAALAGDARAAGFRDLERDAEARESQLRTSSRKLGEIVTRLAN
jgi:DNA repair exonuclease SbcCD ATPase subunit